MLLRRQCLHRPSLLFVSSSSSQNSRRFVLNYTSKSEATATYEQLLREQAPLITYLDSDGVSSVSKGGHTETCGGEGEGLHPRKPNKDLQDYVERFRTLKAAYEDTVQLFDSPELVELAVAESDSLLSSLRSLLTHELPNALLPPSETDELSALVELKAGVGGSESSLFVADMLRMYGRFARLNNWSPTVLASSGSDSGGFKDALLEVKGVGAYGALRWESGVHRVQRVPATEASGRVHTSTVAAVVLPLSEESRLDGADDLLKQDDVRVEVMRARGAGGQHVNKTESAVRLTHIPTGITVSMQDERSQHQNKRRAFQVLRARVLDLKLLQEQAKRRETRKNLVRTADRSEKIRTYNYPQNRMTDHRLGKGSMLSCEVMMEGDGLETVINELKDKNLSETLWEVLDQK